MQDAQRTNPDAAASAETTNAPAPNERARMRPAQPDDAWAISALLGACAPRCVPERPEAVLRTINEWRVMARYDGRIMGSLRLRDRRGESELRGVAVDDDARGLGVGGALLEWALQHQRERGLDLVCITCEPGFFARFGFETESDPPPSRHGLEEAHDNARVRMRRAARTPTA